MQATIQVEEFLPYMPGVAKCERSLRELNFAWRLIESTAKMVCPAEAKTILPTMKATREGFNSLEKQLITNLAQENITKSVQEMQFKAQVIIDIVVRNLFERTADVGFLAMDDAIRAFILDEDRDAGTLVPRLQAYRDKYTVYDEILILDTGGEVLAHLDGASDVSHSSDALIAATLNSDSYVESFHHSDLRPGQERSLIYSRKIVHPRDGSAIGVLCLCFPHAVEMEGVFDGLRKTADRSVMLMLDADGYVISSSDEPHIPVGRQVPLALDGDYQIISYAGRDYFAKTCAAQNYQGYGGPGWLGHVMIPCEAAFKGQALDALSAYDAATLAGIMAHAKTFCPPLHEVSVSAEAINLALRRVVWNGKNMSAGQDSDLLRLKSILQEISQTGDETSRVFKDSIHDLYGTVISSGLQDAQFISRLMIDIMDRNLYERANDCRWWALTPDIRRLMAESLQTGSLGNEDTLRIAQILEAINALYTAYTRLVVFDASGRIVAASDLHKDGLETAGCMMDPALVRKTLALPGSQAYCVSGFEPTWLYADRPTYIYCAAIFHPDENRAVGGIGIVFDSEPEFRNILLSSLPKRAGAFAAFTDRAGNVISSTHAGYPPGAELHPSQAIMQEKTGVSAAQILVQDGQYMMVGHTASFGYREFKNSGDYHNDVIAMVFVPIGEKTEANAADQGWAYTDDSHEPKQDVLEYATFLIDGDVFALPTSHVVEAVETGRMHSASTLKPLISGVLDYQDNSGEPSIFVPVVDMRNLIRPGTDSTGELGEIIVVRQGKHTLGLLVGSLHDVLEFGSGQIDPPLNMFHNQPRFVCNLIKTGSHNRMIQVIDFDSIMRHVYEKKSAAEQDTFIAGAAGSVESAESIESIDQAADGMPESMRA
ncbi:chemotaxis protein CheW [Undibacterium sp. TJN25]|uniref:chemotaxis protein CheW n=1 Tax=Undibacterium sp. TJN25 TaxID=3413056 RepID=UPI003BF11276